jgi:hypothetical protein
MLLDGALLYLLLFDVPPAALSACHDRNHISTFRLDKHFRAHGAIAKRPIIEPMILTKHMTRQ